MAVLPTTIYVDLDDVLCQAARHFLVIIEREFGKQIAYQQLTNFDVGHSCGLTLRERDELYRIVHRPGELSSKQRASSRFWMGGGNADKSRVALSFAAARLEPGGLQRGSGLAVGSAARGR